MTKSKTPKDILANPSMMAMSYGGYRATSRRIQPTIRDIMEDMRILHAMGIRLIRTYNVHLPHAVNVLKAIEALKQKHPTFEMYVMLGAWIDCKNAWTGFEPVHHEESERNEIEVDRAVELANDYPDIVKIIAVGNEAMVRWASEYYVEPWVILKWVHHLQQLKKHGHLNQEVWITSSDNFASWGGGDPSYHTDDLNHLIREVDFISMHTYPMHDTHYHPVFWQLHGDEGKLSHHEKIELLMERAIWYARTQFASVVDYMKSLSVDKPVHIGETGWASSSNGFYGPNGSRACDEFKAGIFHEKMRAWTQKESISCFFFEAFDEPWKDAGNAGGSENHFGLFTVDGKAKYAIWDLVDQGVFDGLTRGDRMITKTLGGHLDDLLQDIRVIGDEVEAD